MARDDKFFHNVKEALQKDGWITTDPFTLRNGNVTFHMDIAAEKVILLAENKKEQIIVEVKSFAGKSFINEFHRSIGQHRNYGLMLKTNNIARKLYLAIPEDIYKNKFAEPFIMEATIANNMSIVTYDPTINRIIQWLPR
jgi:hypothetical protein